VAFRRIEQTSQTEGKTAVGEGSKVLQLSYKEDIKNDRFSQLSHHPIMFSSLRSLQARKQVPRKNMMTQLKTSVQNKFNSSKQHLYPIPIQN
jgi:hypothetical protein